MATDPIAARYAKAVFDTATAEDATDETLEQLQLISTLLQEHADLRQLMLNPDVDPDQKVGILNRVLKGTRSPLVQAFVHMVVSFGRDASLIDIVEALKELVDAHRGRVQAWVRSARPLSEEMLRRLRQRLEQQERKHVSLNTEVHPELLGGVQIVMGHRVIDGSVRRQLRELHQQLQTVRVY